MFYYDYDTNIYGDIENYRNLIKEQKEDISKKETIVDSLTESMICRIKSIIIPYSEKMLHSAWCQQNKPKEERSMFDFVKDDLLERLFDESEIKEVKFENIIPFGYEHFVYQFVFTYKGTKFEVSIPNVKVANKDNIFHMWYGMYILRYEKGKNVWDHIKESYNLEDFKKAIQDFVSWTDGEF